MRKSKNAPADLERVVRESDENLIDKYKSVEISAISRGVYPKSNDEVKERITQYFELCRQYNLRPGMEGLASAVGVSRQTIFNWSNGNNCDEERQAMTLAARRVIANFIEQASLSGRLNPATGIFLLKNWLNYRDEPPRTVEQTHRKALTAEEIAEKYALTDSCNGNNGEDFENPPFNDFNFNYDMEV